MRHPRFSLLHEMRMALIVAVLAAGVTFTFASLFDPFGRSRDAARHATTVVLCTQLASNTQRLGQLERTITESGYGSLTRNERDVYALTMANRNRILDAIRTLHTTCKGAQ